MQMHPSFPEISPLKTDISQHSLDIHVVFGIDDKFLPAMLVSIYTLLKSATNPVNISVFLVGEVDHSKIETLVAQFSSAKLTIRQFNTDCLQNYMKTEIANRFTAASMIPIFIPWLIDTKCLFLDADTLVLKDISNLFSTDLEGSLIGASEPFSLRRFTYPGKTLESIVKKKSLDRTRTALPEWAAKIGFTIEELVTEYFSSGVVLFDVPAIKMLDPSGKKMADIKEKLELCSKAPDQDILNVYFKNCVHYFDVKWNVYKDTLGKRAFLPTDLNSRINTAARDPAILHYSRIYDRKYWENHWCKIRKSKRYQIYRRTCLEIESQTGINVIQMFRGRS